MASLDISIVFICLLADLIILILGIALRKWIYDLFAGVFGMFSVAYFVTNYKSVVIGTFTINFTLFILIYAFLTMIIPFVTMIDESGR